MLCEDTRITVHVDRKFSDSIIDGLGSSLLDMREKSLGDCSVAMDTVAFFFSSMPVHEYEKLFCRSGPEKANDKIHGV